MHPAPLRGLLAVLELVADPRGRQGQRHSFTPMMAAIICVTLCGARGGRPIAQWQRLQESQTWHWLGFKRTPPCANCFADLLKVICPHLTRKRMESPTTVHSTWQPMN